MTETIERTTRGLLRSRRAWAMLVAGPVAFVGMWSMKWLAGSLPTVAGCGDERQKLCSADDVLSAWWVALLGAVLAGLVMALTVVWIAWAIALPMTVVGLMLLSLSDHRAARRLLLGGTAPQPKTSVTGAIGPRLVGEADGNQDEAPSTAPEADEPVIIRMDGDETGRFDGLEEAQTRAIEDGAWIRAMAHLEFVEEDSGVVLERWSKRDYPERPVER